MELSLFSFLYTVVNIRAIYITAIIFTRMFSLETLIDAQSTITVLTVVYSLSFTVLAADNTLSCWFTFSFCGRYYSWKLAFHLPFDVVTILVT